ncbi:hypothetical protein [Tranquillimonas rosea]|uniref:hypothetical protein n=1 Tax=Tranquillimonas rosea TaxID=641238 RepID=UPI003BAC3182
MHTGDGVRHAEATVVGNGNQSDMPGFGDVLTDDEIGAILDDMKSTWPVRIREAQAGQAADGTWCSATVSPPGASFATCAHRRHRRAACRVRSAPIP